MRRLTFVLCAALLALGIHRRDRHGGRCHRQVDHYHGGAGRRG